MALMWPFFFIGGFDYYDPRSLKALWNLGHFIFFGMFALVLDSYWCALGRSIFFRITITILILVFVGLGIELVQLKFAHRVFSLSDVFRDLSGGAVALFWKGRLRLPRIQSILGVLLSISVVAVNFLPLGFALIDEFRSYKDFPLLSGFESGAELSRWDGSRVSLCLVPSPQSQGRYSGKITLTTDKYSGVSLDHFPGDWGSGSGLAFDVFNPGPQMVLHYRVHDYHHQITGQNFTDRYNGSTVLEYGWNEIVIPITDIMNGPKDRKMDVTKISGLGLFVMNQPEQRVLFIDNVRLL